MDEDNIIMDQTVQDDRPKD
jgi:hypothetical protein